MPSAKRAVATVAGPLLVVIALFAAAFAVLAAIGFADHVLEALVLGALGLLVAGAWGATGVALFRYSGPGPPAWRRWVVPALVVGTVAAAAWLALFVYFLLALGAGD